VFSVSAVVALADSRTHIDDTAASAATAMKLRILSQ
jgi:hypothetical protein